MNWDEGVSRFSDLLLEFKKEDIWLLHHADCDGCVAGVFCSYVINRFQLNLTRRIWVLSSEYDLGLYKELIRKHTPTVLIFLDLDVVSDGVLLGDWKKKVKRILIYDHHKVETQELKKLLIDHNDIFYLNPRLLPEGCSFPASYFGYSMFRKFQDEDSRTWLMGAGLIGDHALDENQGLKEKILSEYYRLLKFKSKSKGEKNLQEITSMINAGYFHCNSQKQDVSFELAYNAFLENNPSLFFDSRFDLTREIKFRKYEVATAVSGACAQARQFAIRDEKLPLIVYILESKHYISGLVASALSATFRNDVIVVGQAWRDKFSFEIRRGKDCSIDITQILRIQRSYYKTLSAGGHSPACGALVIREDREKFIDTFRKAFLELYNSRN